MSPVSIQLHCITGIELSDIRKFEATPRTVPFTSRTLIVHTAVGDQRIELFAEDVESLRVVEAPAAAAPKAQEVAP